MRNYSSFAIYELLPRFHDWYNKRYERTKKLFLPPRGDHNDQTDYTNMHVTILRRKELKSHTKINTIWPTLLQRSVAKVIGGLNAFYTQETFTHCSKEKVNEAP